MQYAHCSTIFLVELTIAGSFYRWISGNPAPVIAHLLHQALGEGFRGLPVHLKENSWGKQLGKTAGAIAIHSLWETV